MRLKKRIFVRAVKWCYFPLKDIRTHKGSVHQMLPQLTGGLRSGMGLADCATIDELRTKSRFLRVTPAGLKESHAHDVVITKESPNYWVER